MSTPSTALPQDLALSRGLAIEYKAYARHFQPSVDASVLILVAACYYETSGFTISFQSSDSGYQLVEQPPTEIFRNMVTYYIASWTTGLETDTTPTHVTIADSHGQHRVRVEPWLPSHQLSLPHQMVSQAEFIVNNLWQTDYQHQQTIDVDRGIYDCDCNGFLSFVLERSAPDHYARLPKEADQPRPRAFEYYDFFDSLTPESTGGWRRINSLSDARRGDIIAWRFPKIELHHDTGHVLIAAGTPSDDGSGIFSVHVYDSAVQPHFGDTRGKGAGKFAKGIGSGVIKFKVDDAGRPIAFQFAPSDQFKSLPIAIGRLEPLSD